MVWQERREGLKETACAKALGEAASCVARHRAPGSMEGSEARDAGQPWAATALTGLGRPSSRTDVIQTHYHHSLAFGLVGGVQVLDSPDSKDSACGINSIFKDPKWGHLGHSVG